MNYDIQIKSDFMTGAYLVTRILEKDLDKNALHTIQTDCPDFILPFHYKNTNGQIELTYKIGARSKLQYFSGECSPKEYTQLWQSLLKPLLECGDWFMNPCSFVLDTDYLYYDKTKKTVSYLYIPSLGGCSGYDAFNAMAFEISKMMTVSDASLENKVLRSILENFNPIDFLKMLKDHVSESAEASEIAAVEAICERQSIREEENESDNSDSKEEADSSLLSEPDAPEDIVIDIQSNMRAEQRRKERESGGYRMFSGKSKRKSSPRQTMPKAAVTQPEKAPRSIPQKADSVPKITAPLPNNVTPMMPMAEIIDITQNTSIMLGGPGLRYVGRAHLPQAIQIMIAEGEIFTIGRFDATIGKKQSSFEFDKKTRAVSRRHAVIERDVEGYKIIDLSSSAGTYVNDKKLPPNTPFGLETGCRVSFGNSGADYVWEVS